MFLPWMSLARLIGHLDSVELQKSKDFKSVEVENDWLDHGLHAQTNAYLMFVCPKTNVCIYSVSIDQQSVTFKRYISYSMLYQNTLCHGWSWAWYTFLIIVIINLIHMKWEQWQNTKIWIMTNYLTVQVDIVKYLFF